MKLEVSMGVLGKRKSNLWCRGTVVQTAEKGHKYKVEFKKGKKIVLPAHHVASEKHPVLEDLFIGCRVVASYRDKKGKILFNAAVLVELPERKNHMRFLVFYDDGQAAYLALRDLHVVCKQLKKVWRDIEDEKNRLQVKEYLRVYPNPIAVVLRIGQDTKVMRNGKFEECTVLQLDDSLIQICYKKDKQKEWVYKGSDLLEHIANIKKHLSKEKPQQDDLQKTQQKTQQSPQQKTQQSIQQKSQQTPPQKAQQPDKTGNAVLQHNLTSSSTKVASASVASATLTSAVDTTVTKTPSISPQNIMFAAFQPKVILQKLSMEVIFQKLSVLSPVLPADGVSKNCMQTVKSATAISTSNLRCVMGLYWLNMGWDGILITNHLILHSRSAKRPSPDEEEVYVSEEEVHISVQDQYKSRNLYHRCCSACLDGIRPTQVNMHHGQNPLLIPLLFKFRRMTARRRIKGKVFSHIFYRSPCGRSLCDMQEVQE